MLVIESDPLSISDWLFTNGEDRIGAFWWFLLAVLAMALAGLVLGFLAAAVRHGPMKAGDMTYRVVITGLREIFRISPRRVWALASLVIKESIRRRVVLVAMLVYVALLLMANWFLKGESADPLKLYLSFVLTATMYLVLLLALFVSSFNLPNDIKSRTIFTVVTKPVGSGEIVLGRILGFVVVGSVLLAAMGALSYAFVYRAVSHTHTIVEADLTPAADSTSAEGVEKRGRTSRDLFHRHDVRVRPDGEVVVDTNLRHWHEVEVIEGDDGNNEFVVSQPHGLFRARVPVRGKLRFKDRQGRDVARGISVGNEWAYRSFIEGGTQAAAIWTFDDVSEERFGDELPLELYILVYRSYKGNIEKGILGSIVLRNPETGVESDVVRNFAARDFYIDEQYLPRKLTSKDGKPLDLYDDLVGKTGEFKGKLEVWIRCLHKAQYFGMAQADVYLHEDDASFDVNFIKGFLSIWSQMVIVTCFGVLFSTFLSGPVAMIATLGAVIMGYFSEFIVGVAQGTVMGGGPIESLIRTVNQTNVTTQLNETFGIVLAKTFDKVIMFVMESFVMILPNFSQFDNTGHVAYGFNIPGSIVGQHVLICLAYMFGAFVAGYFFLRIREVAK